MSLFPRHCSSALLFAITRLRSPRGERIENHLYIFEHTNIRVFSDRTWTLIQQPLFCDFKKCLRNFYFNFWVICFDLGVVCQILLFFWCSYFKDKWSNFNTLNFCQCLCGRFKDPWTVLNSNSQLTSVLQIWPSLDWPQS